MILIVGTDLNINTDEEKDKDGKVKEHLEKFARKIDLFEKTKLLTDDALMGGTALLARVFKAGYLTNIEQFDMTTLQLVKRDAFGNVIDYLISDGNGSNKSIKELGIKNVNQVLVPLRFRTRGRDFFGRSVFHGLAVTRNVGNRSTRPIIEALWSLDDVVIGTMENFAYPVEWHIFEGANDTDLANEAEKYKEHKPGDAFFTNRGHEIEKKDAAKVEFGSFFEHMSNIVQLGTGFPLEILLGDFTSRASSQTTDSLLMRRVKAFQQHLVKIIKTEILEVYLKNNGDGLTIEDDDAIAALNISVEFETQTPMEYTPDQVLARGNAGVWTKTK